MCLFLYTRSSKGKEVFGNFRGSGMGYVAEEERRILVAVDESEESLHALSWCLTRIISAPNSHITLLHVKPPTVVFPGKFPDETAEMYSSHDVLFSQDWRDKQMACWVIEKAKIICQDHHVKAVEAKVEEGDPAEVICQAAETLAPDLLVLGSHVHGPTARALMGSVSNDCVIRASCPVLVVKKPKT